MVAEETAEQLSVNKQNILNLTALKKLKSQSPIFHSCPRDKHSKQISKMSSSLRRSPRLAAKVARQGWIKVARGTLKHFKKSIASLNSDFFDREEVIQEILDDIAPHITDEQVCIAYTHLLAAQEFAKQMEEEHIKGLTSSKALLAKMDNNAVKAYRILGSRLVEE